ncbi:hypothetical protein [Corynebacterium caspium]|uniref:hypothetical protein n=1 Tax=Corynebacterium caspium TaxID=234828 RepID=UPI0003724AE2|nr:hypothetical protein [Corynebacterium caspium]WKD58722.1 hypothetical protein CCASP_01480 [Corynebacterium caspium DSM 44850]
MPPKVTESRPAPETLHRVEEETAAAARRIVATYAEDMLDGLTLMSMLGVEPEHLDYKRAAAELTPAPKPKKTTKKAAKKTTAKKATKKTTAKKTTKKAAKKTTKKSPAKKA